MKSTLWRMRDGEPGDDRAEQLALAGAGGPDQHAVRSHAALCRLLEVQHQRIRGERALVPGAANADGDAQQAGPRSGAPGPDRVDGGGVAEA